MYQIYQHKDSFVIKKRMPSLLNTLLALSTFYFSIVLSIHLCALGDILDDAVRLLLNKIVFYILQTPFVFWFHFYVLRFWLLYYKLEWSLSMMNNEWKSIINHNNASDDWFILHRNKYGSLRYMRRRLVVLVTCIALLVVSAWVTYWEGTNESDGWFVWMVYVFGVFSPPTFTLFYIAYRLPHCDDFLALKIELKYSCYGVIVAILILFIFFAVLNSMTRLSASPYLSLLLWNVVVLWNVCMMRIHTQWVLRRFEPVLRRHRNSDASLFSAVNKIHKERGKADNRSNDSDGDMFNSNRKWSVQKLLRHSKLYEMFMQHLWKEHCSECLLCITEFVQFQYLVAHHCQAIYAHSAGEMHEWSIDVDTLVDLHILSPTVPQSSIVFGVNPDNLVSLRMFRRLCPDAPPQATHAHTHSLLFNGSQKLNINQTLRNLAKTMSPSQSRTSAHHHSLSMSARPIIDARGKQPTFKKRHSLNALQQQMQQQYRRRRHQSKNKKHIQIKANRNTNKSREHRSLSSQPSLQHTIGIAQSAPIAADGGRQTTAKNKKNRSHTAFQISVHMEASLGGGGDADVHVLSPVNEGNDQQAQQHLHGEMDRNCDTPATPEHAVAVPHHALLSMLGKGHELRLSIATDATYELKATFKPVPSDSADMAGDDEVDEETSMIIHHGKPTLDTQYSGVPDITTPVDHSPTEADEQQREPTFPDMDADAQLQQHQQQQSNHRKHNRTMSLRQTLKAFAKTKPRARHSHTQSTGKTRTVFNDTDDSPSVSDDGNEPPQPYAHSMILSVPSEPTPSHSALVQASPKTTNAATHKRAISLKDSLRGLVKTRNLGHSHSARDLSRSSKAALVFNDHDDSSRESDDDEEDKQDDDVAEESIVALYRNLSVEQLSAKRLQLLHEYKEIAHQLWYKYVRVGAEYEINIDYATRKRMHHLMRDKQAWLNNDQFPEKELYLLFQPCVQKMLTFLSSSFSRFRLKPDFDRAVRVAEFL